MSDILNKVVAAIEAVNTKPFQQSGKGFRLQCPAHDGKDRNLYIADGDKKLIIKCHSHQCDPKDILESVGLSLQDIYYDSGLTPQEKKQYKQLKTDKQIKKELVQELLVLLLWIDASWQNIFPQEPTKDPARVKQAWRRVIAAGEYYKERVL